MNFTFCHEDETPLQERFDLIVPFSIQLCGDEAQISTFEAFDGIARAYAERFADDLFCQEGQDYLTSLLRWHLRNWGYGDPCHRTVCTFLADCEGNLPALCEDPALYPIHALPDNTEDLTFLEIDPSQPGYAILLDGKIVSAAVRNDPFFDEEEDAVEIAVETAEDYRHRGYATRVVAALARTLTSEGKRVLYRCDADNLASCRTAMRAGLRPVLHEYHLCAYLQEPAD